MEPTYVDLVSGQYIRTGNTYRIVRTLGGFVLTVGASSAALAQSSMSTNAPPPPKPPIAATMPAHPATDMQAMLDAHAALAPKPIEMLTPVKARNQPAAADATNAVTRAKGMSTALDPAVVTQDLPYGADPFAICTNLQACRGDGRSALPIIVYYHGGGWVIADINTYDATPRLL